MNHAGGARKRELRQHLPIDLQRLAAVKSQPAHAEVADSGVDFSNFGDSRYHRYVDRNASGPSSILQHGSVRGPHTPPGMIDVRGLVNHEVCANQKGVRF